MTAAAPAPSALNSHVLVLNKLWVAVRVVDARRAFSMVARDLAQVIQVDDGSYRGHDFSDWQGVSLARARHAQRHGGDPDHEWVRTVRFDLAVPRVIRLLKYDRVPRREAKLNRRNIFARDHNRCQYCGKGFSTSELSLDHVVPRSQGGGASWQNLVCCCVSCNSRKGGRTPVQAHMPLIRRPVRPPYHPVLAVRIGHKKYASWKAFLDQAYWSVELK